MEQTYAQTLTITSIPAYVINFTGTPYTEYEVQTTTNLTTPGWQNAGLVSGNGNGVYSFTNFPGAGGQLFYRTLDLSMTGTNTQAILSLDASSPPSNYVGVGSTTTGQSLGLPILVFDVTSTNGTIHEHSVLVHIASSGDGSVTAAYLYQGTTPIASASVINGVATFANIPDGQAGATIPANATVSYVVEVDVSGLTGQGAQETVSASVVAPDVTLLDSSDNVVEVSSQAQGSTTTVFGQGPLFSLANVPTIQKIDITPGGATTQTFQYTATFNVNVTAFGENVRMALPASQWPPAFETNSQTATMFVNGIAQDPAAFGVIVNYTMPSNVLPLSGAVNFEIAQNQTVTIPVTYTWTVTNPGANTYFFGMKEIHWYETNNNQDVYTIPDPQDWRTQAF